MRNYSLLLSFCTLLMSCSKGINGQGIEKNVEHVKVFYEPGQFAAWPANHGIWNWGNEILVGFAKATYKDMGPSKHNVDKGQPEYHVLSRSMDGGKTWKLEDPGKNGDLLVPDNGVYQGSIRQDAKPLDIIDSKGIDFKNPDLALTFRMTNIDGGDTRYWYSYNRGHAWKGPFGLPNFGTQGLAARTDYIIDSKSECILFLTASKTDGKEGRVFCVKTIDGGKNWSFLSWIGSEPAGFSIMPASVRLSKNEILVTTRRHEGEKRYIAAYLSKDNGNSWTEIDNPAADAGIGNPPAILKMTDGRLCLIYGYRASEEAIRNKVDRSEIRAKLSDDNGKSWSADYVLRNDGSGWDLGYPRVVQRPDGKIVALYYFMDAKTGPERYIAASIWTPPALEKKK